MELLSWARTPHAICRRGTVDPVGHVGNVTDMEAPPLERKLVAILAADIEGL